MALKQTRRAVSLSADIYRAVKHLADEQGISGSQLVTELVRAAFNGVPMTAHQPLEVVRKAVKAKKRHVISGRAVVRRIAGMGV
jgi:hypothetical protein